MEEDIIKKKKNNYLVIILIGIIVILIGYSVYMTLELKKLQSDISIEDKFPLVSPEISKLSVHDFLEKQKTLTISYKGLKPQLVSLLNHSKGYYGLYFEDLDSGSWIGINERDNKFIPASLLKLPTMIAVLKRIELGEVNLSDKIKIRKQDIDTQSGQLGYNGENYEISVDELLNYMIKKSDNTAVNTLNSQVLTPEQIVGAGLAMGLPLPNDSVQYMSPKTYSNMLRSLYLSSYLRRTFSQKGLLLMTETDFNSEIPAKLPKDIQVAHKVGFNDNGGYYHDCGIVYYPKKPYILCVMSANSTQAEANDIISNASRIIYDYVDNGKTG